MVTKCYYKPTRTKVRTFTAKDCGRIVCAAIADGVLPDDIEKELEKCLGERDKACEKEKSLVRSFAAVAGAILTGLAIFTAPGRAVSRTLAIIRRVFPRQAKEIDDIIEKGLSEAEKTERILRDIIRRARDLERETA